MRRRRFVYAQWASIEKGRMTTGGDGGTEEAGYSIRRERERERGREETSGGKDARQNE